jgi:hypothetical protein
MVDRLLPEPLNKIVLDLLWECACWHALAKLRLHTETTVRLLESFTMTLGCATRRFGAACKDVDTKELPGEKAAQGRHKVALAKQGKASKVKTKEKQMTTKGRRRH